MLYHIQFSLKYEKQYYLKDGLTAYRNITQSSNVSSLETVLKYYLESVEKGFNSAIKNVSNHSDFMKEIEDEDNPEDLFLNTLEDKIDFIKEDVSRKWKLLMEAYRLELELIYRNKKLEDMYCNVAKKAMRQCKKYSKKADFKRLCEVIRLHQYQNVKAGEKTAGQVGMTFALNIKDPDTNDRLIDLRFTQLTMTKEMQLWQDAYKVIEDVNVLLKNRSKTPIDLLLKYYEQVYEIFWNSNHYLLHAVSLHSFFACLRKKSEEKEQVRVVNQLILASLSIPKGNLEETANVDIFRKNALLINSAGQIMNREQLLANLKNGSYLDLCHPQVREIFVLMTDCKDILKFAQKVEAIFAVLKESPEFDKYMDLIEQNIIANLLDKLGTLYKSMSFATFKKLLGFLDFSKCEKYLLYHHGADGGRVQVDYQSGMIIFKQGTSAGDRAALALAAFVNDVQVATRSLQRVRMADSNEQASLEKQALINAKLALAEAEEDTRRKREEGSKATMAANLIIQQRDEILNQRMKEEEEKKQLLKQERKFQEVDQKTLVIFSERVKNILKMDKNASYKGKKLDMFTDTDYYGISIDILIDIENSIKAKKQRLEEDKLEKQFKNRDYLERLIRKKRLEVFLKERDSKTVDLATLEEQAKVELAQKLEVKEKLKGVSGFVNSFKEKINKDRMAVYQQQKEEYLRNINETFASTVYKNAFKKKTDDEEKLKKEQERAKQLAESLAQTAATSTAPAKPQPTGLMGRSQMTSAEMQGTQPQKPVQTERQAPEAKTLGRGNQTREELKTQPAAPSEKPEEKPKTDTKKSDLMKAFDEPETTGKLSRGFGNKGTLTGKGTLLQQAPPAQTQPAPVAGPGPLLQKGTLLTRVEKPEETGPAPVRLGRGNLAPQQPTTTPTPAPTPAPQKPPEKKGRAFG
jgi:translation initiation factor 3 subunit A